MPFNYLYEISTVEKIKKFLFPYYPKKFLATTSFMVLLALMLALRIVLQFFSLPVPAFGFKISISWLPIYVVGFFFGPVVGMFFGFLSDTINYLIHGGVWFWMYAIQEPVVGLVSGILGSLYFMSKKDTNSLMFKISWRLMIYGFAFFCVYSIFSSLDLIQKGTFYGSKGIDNDFILAIVIACMMLFFLIVIEILNAYYFKRYKKFKKNNNIYKLFIYTLIAVNINIMLFSFLLGPSIQLAYLEYIGSAPPNGFLKHGVVYLLIPRILKECVKTPIYIILLFSILWALKTQYLWLINSARNKWEHQTKNPRELIAFKKMHQALKQYRVAANERRILFLVLEKNELTLSQINYLIGNNCSFLVQKLCSSSLLLCKQGLNHEYYYQINHQFLGINH